MLPAASRPVVAGRQVLARARQGGDPVPKPAGGAPAQGTRGGGPRDRVMPPPSGARCLAVPLFLCGEVALLKWAVWQGDRVIVRVSEARVRPERFDDFREMVVSAVREFPGRYAGLVDHEVLAAPPHSLLYVSRWRGEEDLVAYAGEGWRDQPVVLPGEEEYLLGPLQVRHFTVASLD